MVLTIILNHTQKVKGEKRIKVCITSFSRVISHLCCCYCIIWAPTMDHPSYLVLLHVWGKLDCLDRLVARHRLWLAKYCALRVLVIACLDMLLYLYKTLVITHAVHYLGLLHYTSFLSPFLSFLNDFVV